jgi:hypothetical protein
MPIAATRNDVLPAAELGLVIKAFSGFIEEKIKGCLLQYICIV